MSWQWAVLASVAMVCQDLLSTWLVMAEADGRASRAGLLDMLNWPMGMAVTFTTVEALAGHDLALKVAVCAGVSAANYIGTGVAVRVGGRMRRPAACCPHCAGARGAA